MPSLALGLAVAGAVAGLRRLRGRLALVAVGGGSMAPSLLPGDWLVVESLTYRRRPPRIGEIVLAPDPRHRARELVKRAFPGPGGGVTLRGDAAAASTDSRAFGDVPAGEVRWRAIFRYWPLARAGRLA